MHGELQSGDFPDYGSPGIQAFASDALVLHICGLQSALGRYRAALRQADVSRPIADPAS